MRRVAWVGWVAWLATLAPGCARKTGAEETPKERLAPGNTGAPPAPPAPVDSARGNTTAVLPGRAGQLSYLERLTGGAAPEDAVPMIVVMHGMGDRPESFLPLFDGFPSKARIISLRGITPHMGGFSWFFSRRDIGTPEAHANGVRSAAQKVDEALTELRAHRPTVGKPIVTGFSQGGMLCFTLAVHFPEAIAASFPLAGWLPDPLVPKAMDPAKTYPPVFALHGTDDTMLPLAPTKSVVERLKALGFPVELQEFPGVGHSMRDDMQQMLLGKLEKAVAEAQKRATAGSK